MSAREAAVGAPLSDTQWLKARTLAQQSGAMVVTQAVEQLLSLTPAQALEATATKLRCEACHCDTLQGRFNPAFDRVSYTEALSRGVLVGQLEGDWCVVLVNPLAADTEDWAVRRLPRLARVRLMLAHPTDFADHMAVQEGRLRAIDGVVGSRAVADDDAELRVISLASIGGESSPVVKLVNSTIFDALQLKASDIHLECDAGCLRVLYRIDGVMVEITQVAGHDMAEQVVSRVKVMAELDIAERRVPQDGRFRVRVNGRDIDFRVSVMPNIYGEDAVLRLLDRQSLTQEAQTLTLEKLGLDVQAIQPIRRLASKPHGMLLVTGPTGSGKTTTLYAAITEIHTGRDKIVTIEDPVEYRLPRVLQIPVNEKKGLTFARGLRSILRHDPDKIMVGEIRDDETAQIAVQAALTGHLVFTTVHANSVFDVLGRFLHMGVDAYSFAAALNGIVSQRLVRMNCPHCAEPALPDPELLDAMQLSREVASTWSYRVGRGCAQCRGTGFKGRRAAAEVLVLDDVLRELIATRAPISALKQRARDSGMRGLQESALRWVASGETTLDEVLRVAG